MGSALCLDGLYHIQGHEGGHQEKKIWPKSNEAFSKIRGTNPKKQQSILDTNNCKLKRPIPNDAQRIIVTKTKEMRTKISTNTRLGAGEIQWVSTRH